MEKPPAYTQVSLNLDKTNLGEKHYGSEITGTVEGVNSE